MSAVLSKESTHGSGFRNKDRNDFSKTYAFQPIVSIHKGFDNLADWMQFLRDQCGTEASDKTIPEFATPHSIEKLRVHGRDAIAIIEFYNHHIRHVHRAYLDIAIKTSQNWQTYNTHAQYTDLLVKEVGKTMIDANTKYRHRPANEVEQMAHGAELHIYSRAVLDRESLLRKQEKLEDVRHKKACKLFKVCRQATRSLWMVNNAREIFIKGGPIDEAKWEHWTADIKLAVQKIKETPLGAKYDWQNPDKPGAGLLSEEWINAGHSMMDQWGCKCAACEYEL